jgi:hypothetical protein
VVLKINTTHSVFFNALDILFSRDTASIYSGTLKYCLKMYHHYVNVIK